ncbi:MAG: sigma-70 family RNA polymerase sigma factor [Phycisphaerae bacterium]|nr:sigma-70 family RNA polymerase sigma factor [Phycisphaerae bacterium]
MVLPPSATNRKQVLLDCLVGQSRRCFRLAWGVLRDVHAAEDVCQEAFLKAMQKQAQIRDPNALAGWLLRVVVNESLALLRRRQVDERARDKLKADGPHAEASLDGAEREEFTVQFQRVLGELPLQTQTVVVMRLVEGMSGNEVSRVLSCSPSEVSRRLHTGLEHLRQRLGSIYALEAQ